MKETDKEHIIEIINATYNTDDGKSIFKKVLSVMNSVFQDSEKAIEFSEFFISQLAPSGAMCNVSLLGLAEKWKKIVDEFETDIYGKNDTIHFIHKLLLRQARNSEG